jgi:hypothetical protein
MDPAYEHIFDDLYNVWSQRDYPDRLRILQIASYQSNEPMNTVHRTIESAQEALEKSEGLRLRSDARYFLLMNLSEMVVRPIQMRTGEYPFVGRSAELDGIIRADLDLLLSDAARRHVGRQQSFGVVRRPDREISGHSVVEALAANWTRLKLNSYRIWGER